MAFILRTEDLLQSLSSDLLLLQETGGVFSTDNLPQKEIIKKSYIINTDPSYLPGKHWVVVYFPKDSSGEFFDSLGRSPASYSHYILDFLIENSSKEFIYNTQVLQPSRSSTCGMYCLFFLYYRVRGFSFEKILKYFSKNLEHNDNIVIEFFFHHFGME